jgi:probable phosphoglycerate mutase
MSGKYPEIHVLRHGQTEWNLEGRFQGGRDSPLTEKGRADAAAQGEILKRERVIERGLSVFSSPQARVQATADIALAICGGHHAPDPRLVEVTRGAWEGLLIGEIEQRWPEIHAGGTGDICWYFDNPTCEPLESVWARATGFPESLSGPAVIVTHGITSHILRGIWPGPDLQGAADLRGGQGWVHHLKDGKHATLEL